MPAVRVEEDAFSDLRFAELAALCGLADADHARGKMLHIWRQCTLECDYSLSAIAIDSILGANGAQNLVESRLGTVDLDGRIRIHGTEGRVEWLAKVRKNGRKGGLATKAKWRSDARPTAPLNRKGNSTPTREQEQEQEISGSGSGFGSDVSGLSGASGSGGPRAERDQNPTGPTQDQPRTVVPTAVPSTNTVLPSTSPTTRSTPTTAPIGSDPAAVLRRRLVDAFVARVNAARAIISAECNLGAARPIAQQGLGERELVERLKESADPAADLNHVLEVAIAEARSRRELRWLGWSIAEPKAWRTRLATSLSEARKNPNRSAFDDLADAHAAAAEAEKLTPLRTT